MDSHLFGWCWGRVPEWRSYQWPHYYYAYPYTATSYGTPVNSDTAKSTKAPAMNENTAAIKIQAAFRGFRVRKLRPLNTKAEAAEIQRRVNDEHFVEQIRRDEKERLKILLLSLDGIQVAIPFVNLQETAHDIIAAKPREDAIREVSVTCEATVEEKLNEEFKRKELSGDAIEVSVSNEKGEESLPSQMQEDNNNNGGVENFEQGSSEAGQIVSGTEECTMVDDADKDAVNLKRNNVESPVSEVDASPTIPCTKEWVIVGNARDDENSFESLDLLKVQTTQPDVKVETADFMDGEEAGDKLPEKVKPTEEIGMVRLCSLM